MGGLQEFDSQLILHLNSALRDKAIRTAYGEVLVFTGALTIPRRDAADLAASIGCEVDPGVTKRTTLLVVGDQDVRRLAGHNMSSKHRKAEELIKNGWPIRIIRETDFRELVELSKNAS
jgi:DNA polymerase-3 subunit epsilon